MSDSAAPGGAAPVSAPAAPAAAEAPAVAARPSLFRTDANAADDPILNKPAPKIAPIRDAPRDPASGKFVPATQRASADPNSGVIDEIAGGEEQPEAPGQPQDAPEPEPEQRSFRVEVDGSVFTDEKALAAHIKRLTAHNSSVARRAADLERMNAELQQKLAPPAPAAAAEAPAEIGNPFEKSALDNEELIRAVHADLDSPDKGVPVALFRVVDHLEKQIKSLTDFINKEQGAALAPMQQFLGAMASINQTSEFMANMSVATDEATGELRYPEMRSRPAIQALTTILRKHNLPLTPENFDLAYQVQFGPSKPGERQQPQERFDPAANRAAAASAAVASGRTRVPDPRAEPRKLSVVEEMNQVQTHRGMFRTTP